MESKKLNMNEIPKELSTYFWGRIIIISLFGIANLLIMLSTQCYFEFGLLFIPIIICYISKLVLLKDILCERYEKFYGVCSSIKKPEANIIFFGHVYGYSHMTLTINDNIQVTIPITNHFEVGIGDIISFFAKPDDFIQASQVIWKIDSPICTKVEKKNTQPINS